MVIFHGYATEKLGPGSQYWKNFSYLIIILKIIQNQLNHINIY